MTYKILEVSKDIANKYRTRVQISKDEAIFLKFDHKPSQTEVDNFVSKHIESTKLNKAFELESIDRQIEDLNIRKIELQKEINGINN